MSIFPFLDGAFEQANQTSQTKLPVPKEYLWDFNSDNFKLENGKPVKVEGLEAIKVWIYKTLKTPRFKHLGYSWNYGNELDNIIGGAKISQNALVSEVKRYLEESLLINPYIKSIGGVSASLDESRLTIKFTANTDYGEVVFNV